MISGDKNDQSPAMEEEEEEEKEDENLKLIFRPDNTPLKFYFHRSLTDGQCGIIAKNITSHGGHIVNKAERANVIIVAPTHLEREKLMYGVSEDQKKRRTRVEPASWVRKCIVMGRLEYTRASLPKGMPGRPGGRIGVGRMRVPFTREDDDHLCWYLSRRLPRQKDGGRMGISVYQQLEDLGDDESEEYSWVRRHTWQSWRERYKKREKELDPIIEKYAKVDPVDEMARYQLHRRPLERVISSDDAGEEEDSHQDMEGSDDRPARRAIPRMGQTRRPAPNDQVEEDAEDEEDKMGHVVKENRTYIRAPREERAARIDRHPSHDGSADGLKEPADNVEVDDSHQQRDNNESGPSGTQRTLVRSDHSGRGIHTADAAQSRPAPLPTAQIPMSSQATLVGGTQVPQQSRRTGVITRDTALPAGERQTEHAARVSSSQSRSTATIALIPQPRPTIDDASTSRARLTATVAPISQPRPTIDDASTSRARLTATNTPVSQPRPVATLAPASQVPESSSRPISRNNQVSRVTGNARPLARKIASQPTASQTAPTKDAPYRNTRARSRSASVEPVPQVLAAFKKPSSKGKARAGERETRSRNAPLQVIDEQDQSEMDQMEPISIRESLRDEEAIAEELLSMEETPADELFGGDSSDTDALDTDDAQTQRVLTQSMRAAHRETSDNSEDGGENSPSDEWMAENALVDVVQPAIGRQAGAGYMRTTTFGVLETPARARPPLSAMRETTGESEEFPSPGTRAQEYKRMREEEVSRVPYVPQEGTRAAKLLKKRRL